MPSSTVVRFGRGAYDNAFLVKPETASDWPARICRGSESPLPRPRRRGYDRKAPTRLAPQPRRARPHPRPMPATVPPPRSLRASRRAPAWTPRLGLLVGLLAVFLPTCHAATANPMDHDDPADTIASFSEAVMREAMWDMYDADTGAALDNSKAISLNVDAENTDEVDLALFVDDDDHPGEFEPNSTQVVQLCEFAHPEMCAKVIPYRLGPRRVRLRRIRRVKPGRRVRLRRYPSQDGRRRRPRRHRRDARPIPDVHRARRRRRRRRRRHRHAGRHRRVGRRRRSDARGRWQEAEAGTDAGEGHASIGQPIATPPNRTRSRFKAHVHQGAPGLGTRAARG